MNYAIIFNIAIFAKGESNVTEIRVSIVIYTELYKTNQVSWNRTPFWAHRPGSVLRTGRRSRGESSASSRPQPDSEISSLNSLETARRFRLIN